MGIDILNYGQTDADILLVQMVDEHDLEVIENEVKHIRKLSGNRKFCLKAVKVKSWNRDLSPWSAPAVFGNEDFGKGAPETLQYLQEKVLPSAGDKTTETIKKVYIGGYSLAGLFALWTGYQTDRFDGIAAVSPSIWFPGFTEYMRKNRVCSDAVYLSLGDREEKTRNPVMAQVGNAIRDAENILKEAGKDCFLEWNRGTHFNEPALRTAKGFAWLLNRDCGTVNSGDL